jgi:hypothetical protein
MFFLLIDNDSNSQVANVSIVKARVSYAPLNFIPMTQFLTNVYLTHTMFATNLIQFCQHGG